MTSMTTWDNAREQPTQAYSLSFAPSRNGTVRYYTFPGQGEDMLWQWCCSLPQHEGSKDIWVRSLWHADPLPGADYPIAWWWPPTCLVVVSQGEGADVFGALCSAACKMYC